MSLCYAAGEPRRCAARAHILSRVARRHTCREQGGGPPRFGWNGATQPPPALEDAPGPLRATSSSGQPRRIGRACRAALAGHTRLVSDAGHSMLPAGGALPDRRELQSPRRPALRDALWGHGRHLPGQVRRCHRPQDHEPGHRPERSRWPGCLGRLRAVRALGSVAAYQRAIPTRSQ